MPPAVQTLPPIRPPVPRPVRSTFSARRGRSPSAQTGTRPDPLRRVFRLASVGMIAVVVSKCNAHNLYSVLGAVLIILAALCPCYLWIWGKVRGLPLFPACALTCVWTFALPLVTDNPIVTLFPGWNQLVAAFSLTGFLVAGTLTWYWVARRPLRRPASCWMMDERQGSLLLLLTLAVCGVWSTASTAGWIRLPPAVDSVARAVFLAAEALSCFVLSYLTGKGVLTGVSKILFFVFLGIMLVTTLPNLLLIVAMSLTAICMMAYIVASKRLPWLVGLVAFCIFGFLHFGKGDMRERYWTEEGPNKINPLQYPAFFADWAQTSLRVIRARESDAETSDLLERASLMHWMLYFQATTPGSVPFLNGESYTLVPRLLLPRFIDPDKPHGNEGNSMLSIHYGIQTREDTEMTTIAFGLLSEAFANFGYFGLVGLGALLGALYGKVAHWARGMPILSFRTLFAVLIASLSFQAELCATSFATMLFQSSVVLFAFTIVFLRPRRLDSARDSTLE